MRKGRRKKINRKIKVFHYLNLFAYFIVPSIITAVNAPLNSVKILSPSIKVLAGSLLKAQSQPTSKINNLNAFVSSYLMFLINDMILFHLFSYP